MTTMNIGTYVRALMLSDAVMTNAEILAKVKAKFVDGKTSAGCIAWYRSDLRKKGLIEKVESVKKMSAEEYKAYLLDQLAKATD